MLHSSEPPFVIQRQRDDRLYATAMQMYHAGRLDFDKYLGKNPRRCISAVTQLNHPKSELQTYFCCVCLLDI